ncbi:MAG: primosomal protein N' [Opitutae bacterium]|nr:primosomal protein N' [Opitutae bacterium]
MVKREASYVEVLPFEGFGESLTYRLSSHFLERVRLGCLVRVPLGKRIVTGVVLGMTDSVKFDSSKLKNVVDLVLDQPVLTKDLLSLSSWLSSYYACPRESVLEAMIPAPVRRGMKIKQRRLIEISEPMEAAEMESLAKRAPRQAKLLAFLANQKLPVPRIETLSRLQVPATSCDALKKKGLINETSQREERLAYSDNLSGDEEMVDLEVELTDEQEIARNAILEKMKTDTFSVHLLKGVTGSGKTEVYAKVMEKTLRKGGGVLFLVPEVALAPQTVGRLRARFGKNGFKTVVWHSHLSEGERLDAWLDVARGDAPIVVGARSAVFAPLPNLQLVIVDEEHEPAYKQEETPRYHGRDVAVYRAKLNDAACILGSATPSLESMRNAQVGKYELATLTKRVDDRSLPTVHLVDMRRELLKTGFTQVLSQPLRDALRDRFAKREQSILFLNRRGYSTTMLCPECGFTASCEHCSITLTYHRVGSRLRCHFCGYERPSFRHCPECRSDEITRRGTGTQRVEDLVKKAIPKGRVLRLDADVMSKKNLFRRALNDFRRGKIDVLVGTQMIAKGLDFPNVTLVGVVDADLSLRLEDFRAAERTFQLLVQVSGRAGRGDQEGDVYAQTYSPESSAIQFARRSDLDGFVEEEFRQRKEFGYPPFRHLVRHLFRSRSEAKATFFTEQWSLRLREIVDPTEIEVRGPASAPVEKIKGYYRFHLWYFMHSISKSLPKIINLRREFPLDEEVSDVIDVDAQDLS